jgi:hypothetical protein
LVKILWIIAIALAVIGTGTVIFAFIYVRKKENPASKIKNTDRAVKYKKTKESNIKDIWDIEDIRNGVIYLKNSTYAAVVKVGSIDVRLLSSGEQETIEEILIKTVVAIPEPFKFVVITNTVDTSNIINDIAVNALEADTTMKVKALANETIKYLENLMNNQNIYTRENYIVLTYTGEVEKAYEELNRMSEFIIVQMNSAKIKAERITSEKELDFLFKFLNRKRQRPSETANSGAFELYVKTPEEVIPVEGGIDNENFQ